MTFQVLLNLLYHLKNHGKQGKIETTVSKVAWSFLFLSSRILSYYFHFSIEVNQGDRDGPFSIGQTLRIRVGPLKGYLCRVIAIRRSEVTVKLDSQQRVLTGT